MRHSKEIMVLLALFVVMSVGTIWYVIDRRAKNRAQRPVSAHPLVTTSPPVAPAEGDGLNCALLGPTRNCDA